MKLIVNADDFGMTAGVTYGIFDAINRGIVTSTTFMVNGQANVLASQIIKDNPSLAIGLHFNISLGQPLTKAKSLIRNGNFIKPKDMIDDLAYVESDILDELKAQYEKFVDMTGKKPTHIDSHLYTHQKFNKVGRQVKIFAEELGLPVRDTQTLQFDRTAFEGRFKVSSDDNLESMQSKIFRLLTERLNEKVVELMVHPAFVDYFLQNNSSYNVQRILEQRVLTSIETKNFIVDNKIQLVNFGNL